MANETLSYCDLGPAIIGPEKFAELNAQTAGVGGASDLGPAFLSPEPAEVVVEDNTITGETGGIAVTKPKPAARKRAR